MAETVGGTVIQRSFVSSETNSVVHAASVPLIELGTERKEIDDVLVELLGIPRETILDDAQYTRVLETLSAYPYIHPPFFSEIDQYYERIVRDRRDSPPRRALFADFLALAASTPAGWMPWFLWDAQLRLQTEDFNPEALSAALRCSSARAFRGRETDRFIEDVLGYDIPIGQSPTVRSDSLLKLLDTTGKLCIAPLAAGGLGAIASMSTNNYVAALLSAATGAGVTLILVSTVSVASLMVSRVERARSKGGG